VAGNWIERNDMSLRLSREQVKELTGRSWKAKQLDALRAMGIPHAMDDEGWPVVFPQALAKLAGEEPDEKKGTIDPEFLKNLYG